jgi:hypothetical protein
VRARSAHTSPAGTLTQRALTAALQQQHAFQGGQQQPNSNITSPPHRSSTAPNSAGATLRHLNLQQPQHPQQFHVRSPPTHSRHRSLGDSFQLVVSAAVEHPLPLSPQHQQQQQQQASQLASGAASTAFFLPDAPQPVQAASQSDSTQQPHSSQQQQQPRSSYPHPHHSSGLTELVRRLSWDESSLQQSTSGGDEEASMAPEATSSPTPLQHNHPLHSPCRHQPRGSGGNSMDFGIVSVPLAAPFGSNNSQPPSPVLAALSFPPLPVDPTAAPPASSPEDAAALSSSSMDLSMSPSPSPVPLNHLAQHRKIASCPSGLSDMRTQATEQTLGPQQQQHLLSPSNAGMNGGSMRVQTNVHQFGGGNLITLGMHSSASSSPSPQHTPLSSPMTRSRGTSLELGGGGGSSGGGTGSGSAATSNPASAHQSPSLHGMSGSGGAGGKLTASKEGGGHSYHPYARTTTPEQHMHSFAAGLQQAALAAQNQPPYLQHRPTVISPASRFLNRKQATMPAALMQQQSGTGAAVAAGGGSAQTQSMSIPIPPLSLNNLSGQQDWFERGQASSSLPGSSSSFALHHLGNVAGSSAAGAGGMHFHPHQHQHAASASSSPPSSPHANALAQAFGTSAGGSSNGSMRTPTGSPPHRAVNAFLYAPSSPSSTGAGQQMTPQQHAQAHLSSPFHQPHAHAHHHHASSSVSSVASSPMLPPSAGPPVSLLRLPTPDFSGAFDSRTGGWARLSNHSPLKKAQHRSMPGTPSLRAGGAGQSSVPPTPNSRAAKQSRSRRHSANDKSVLDSAALLLDFSNLTAPLQSLPLMHPLPSAPSFDSQVAGSTLLGSGSYGDVYRLEMNNTSGSANPFAQQQILQQQQQQAQLFLSAPPLLDFASSSSSSSGGSSVMSGLSSSASTATAAAAATAPTPTLLALKRTKMAFTSVHERQRMLLKYTHVYGLLQSIQTDVMTQLAAAKAAQAQQQQQGTAALPVSLPTVSSICASMHVDPVTFFPLHLLPVMQVWQEQGRMMVLMPWCERGELTAYWGRPPLPDPPSSDTGSNGGCCGDSVAGADDVLVGDNSGYGSTALPSSVASSTVGAGGEEQQEGEDVQDVEDAAVVAGDDDEDEEDAREAALRDAQYREALLSFTQEHADPSLPIYLTPARTIPASKLAMQQPQRPPPAPLTEATLWRLLAELCSALALMHKHGLLHLDVKPANILVTAPASSPFSAMGADVVGEHFVLADFDSAVQMRSVGETSRANTPPHAHTAAGGGFTNVAALLGSGAALPSSHSSSPIPSSSDVFVDSVEPGDGVWCAPELLQSTLSASPACDIFSLGASVYAVLMDHIPEKDPATGEVQLDFGASAAPTGAVAPVDQQQAQHQLRGHCIVSVELQQLLLAMTASPPSSRPSAAQVLAQADAWFTRQAARQEQAQQPQQPPSSSLAALDCRQFQANGDAAEPMHTDSAAASTA